MTLDLTHTVFAGLGASAGIAAGWKLHGLRTRKKKSWNSDRAFVGQTLSDLQQASDDARTLVKVQEQRLKELENLLEENSGKDEAQTGLVNQLISDNRQAIKQLQGIEARLEQSEDEIKWWLREHPPQKPERGKEAEPTQSERVLDDLKVIAKQVSSTVQKHRQQSENCNSEVDRNKNESSTDIVSAVSALIEAATQMQEDIVRADRKLQAQSIALESQASSSATDSLTGLMNRGEFDREIQRSSDLLNNIGREFAVVMIDLDHFKKINDEFGHQAGDAVLRDVSEVLSSVTRESDFLARYGGEELAWRVLASDEEALFTAAFRALEAIRENETTQPGAKIKATASIGAALARPDESPEETVRRADEALYAAKKNGRDCIYFHNGIKTVSWKNRSPQQKPQHERSGETNTDRRSPKSTETEPPIGEASQSLLSTRTVFFHSVNRSLALWKRGGPCSTVVLLHVDPRPAVEPGSDTAHMLHDAIARVLEANTRDMDHCCDFDRGIYAVLLLQTTAADAVMVAANIRTAAMQVKIKNGKQSVDSVKASAGVAEGSTSDTAIDLISRATAALEASARSDEEAVFVSQPSGSTVAVPLKKRTKQTS